VEINTTFYHQPTTNTVDEWRKQAPAKFLYAVKASRCLTHMRKLNEPRDPLERFLQMARRLKSHLGPLLYQLPPNWKKNLERLRSFVSILPKKQTHVIEFRNRDWLSDDTYELLEEFHVSLCIHDMLPRHPRRVTGPVVYVRFHGPGKKKYAHKYRPSSLQRGPSGSLRFAAKSLFTPTSTTTGMATRLAMPKFCETCSPSRHMVCTIVGGKIVAEFARVWTSRLFRSLATLAPFPSFPHGRKSSGEVVDPVISASARTSAARG
jgi:hypothetical protein